MIYIPNGEGRWGRFWKGPPREEEPLWRRTIRTILAPILWIIWWAWRIFIVILAIALLVVAGIFAYNLFTGGTAQAQITKIGDVLSKTPIIGPATEFLNIIREPARIERTYSFKGEVDEAQENRELGLTFASFKSIKERYLVGEPISLLASIRAMSFKEDSQIKFSCEDTTSEIQGAINPSEPVLLEKNIPKIFTVRCDVNTENINLGDKDIRAERIVLSANYDFKTEAYTPAYTISDEKLKSLQNQEINPFVQENINDPKLNEDTGEATSTYNYGPMKVLVNSQFSQPFTEKGVFTNEPYYDLTILIEQSSLGPTYQGKLSKINNVFLYLPNNFELAQDELEKDFDIVEDVQEEDLIFTKYKLKEEKIKELNEQCTKYNYNTIECSSLWERGFQLALTKFRVAYLSKEDLDRNFIRAEVDYEFEVQISKVITIVKSLTV